MSLDGAAGWRLEAGGIAIQRRAGSPAITQVVTTQFGIAPGYFAPPASSFQPPAGSRVLERGGFDLPSQRWHSRLYQGPGGAGAQPLQQESASGARPIISPGLGRSPARVRSPVQPMVPVLPLATSSCLSSPAVAGHPTCFPHAQRDEKAVGNGSSCDEDPARGQVETSNIMICKAMDDVLELRPGHPVGRTSFHRS